MAGIESAKLRILTENPFFQSCTPVEWHESGLIPIKEDGKFVHLLNEGVTDIRQRYPTSYTPLSNGIVSHWV